MKIQKYNWKIGDSIRVGYALNFSGLSDEKKTRKGYTDITTISIEQFAREMMVAPCLCLGIWDQKNTRPAYPHVRQTPEKIEIVADVTVEGGVVKTATIVPQWKYYLDRNVTVAVTSESRIYCRVDIPSRLHTAIKKFLKYGNGSLGEAEREKYEERQIEETKKPWGLENERI